MKKSSILIILIYISHFCFCQSTNISGIINSYTSVSSIGVQSVTVSTTTGFSTGDKILIIQMKGAVINTNNNPGFGSILNYNDAGNYEIITIASITGTTINFTTPIVRSYSATDLVQLVKIPVYNNAVITSTLLCLPWNGTIGGVLAFEATGSVTLNADIDISGNGFSGGGRYYGSYQCMGDTSAYVLPISNSESSNKGEGIVIYNSNFAEGKGAYANGGGSGNDINGGGAGGGNYGLGGHGGGAKSSGSCPTYYYMNCGGIGGEALLYSNSQNKIFLGGGGGAGHENDNVGTAGVNGGGIILIETGSIIGNGNFIRSDGLDNNVVAGNDGQGGGGAGGTILLNVCSYDSLNISVKGGKGGTDNFTGSDCHGKGGGGAGGIIWSSTPLINVTTFLTGGNPGIFTNSNSTCFGGSNGATAGQTGGILTGLIIPGNSLTISQLDTTICTTTSTVLNAGTASSYTWSTGVNTQTISVNNSGTYWVQIQPQGECNQTDTFHVAIINPAIYSILHDTSICNNTNCVLNASLSNANSYNWSTGSTSSSITTSASGIYWVDMHINQCVIRDSAQITLLNSPVINIPNDTVTCSSPITITINDTVLDYSWSTGNNSNQISITNSGTYWVQVQNQNGCKTSDTIQVTIVTPTTYQILKDTSVCTNANYILNVSSANATSYNWSTGATTSSIAPATTGIYWVDIHIHQCVVKDSARITLVNPPILNLKDTVICKEPIILNITDTSLLINWWDGSHANQISINSEGTYSVSVSKNGCSTTDVFNVKNLEFSNSIIIPNIITPNGDGINDFFEFTTNGIIVKEFYLYNRWGKLIYSTENTVKWDGKQENELVDDGTYYWTAIFNNPCNNSAEDIKQKGFITVLK